MEAVVPQAVGPEEALEAILLGLGALLHVFVPIDRPRLLLLALRIVVPGAVASAPPLLVAPHAVTLRLDVELGSAGKAVEPDRAIHRLVELDDPQVLLPVRGARATHGRRDTRFGVQVEVVVRDRERGVDKIRGLLRHHDQRAFQVVHVLV